ncbi:MAG: ankyrin repeat domain-containing protein [Planctomycetota bacterium]|nr:ankyrin repeat domain-containing protein [Planctomycetota bacterium]
MNGYAALAAGAAAATFEALIRYGHFGQFPMHFRSEGGSPVRDLISQGDFVGDADRQSMVLIDTPMDALLIECYRRGEEPGALIAAAVALHYGANPNVLIDGPILLTHVCAQDGARDFLGVLLDFGAEIDAVTMKEDWTALMWAAAEGRIDVVRLLLDCGAEWDRKSCSGETAASVAAKHGHADVVTTITEAAVKGTDCRPTSNPKNPSIS